MGAFCSVCKGDIFTSKGNCIVCCWLLIKKPTDKCDTCSEKDFCKRMYKEGKWNRREE